jgi:hypothetical protein
MQRRLGGAVLYAMRRGTAGLVRGTRWEYVGTGFGLAKPGLEKIYAGAA